VYSHKSLSPIISVVSLVAFLTLPVSGFAAEAFKAMQWEILADKLTRFEDPPSIIAEGNVVLTKTEKITRKKKVRKNNDWGDLLDEFGPSASADEGVGKDGEAAEPVDTLATSKALPVIQDNVTGTEGEEVGQESDDTLTESAQTDEENITTSRVVTTIKADWMVYDLDLGTVKVRGNVLIDVGSDQLTASSGVVNLNRSTGTFEDSTIIRQYKDMHFEGRIIEKTGDLSYHIEDGWLITCKLKDGETPPWSFKAAEADITDGGYALLKHATFRIKNVPILYTPIMILPAKRTRQTGFLFPSFTQSSRDGFGVEWPFFINLSPSSDITLYPQYITNRGFMAGAEMRYSLNHKSKGAIMGNFLYDDLSDINDSDNYEYYNDGGYTHTNQERYWVRGKADQNFGEWTTRLDFDIVSDRDYLTEFNTGLTGFKVTDKRFSNEFGRGFQNKTSDYRNNTLRLLRSWGNGLSLQANLVGVDDLREDKTSPTPLMKLPEVNFTGILPVYDTGIDFSWKTNYVYFWRDEGVGAHRIDLFPRVTMPVPLFGDYLETVVSAGVRDTMYSIEDNGDDEWAESDTENRFLADFRAEVATTVKRDFAYNGDTVSSWSHTVRPFVRYKYLTDVDQEDLPYFDSVDDVGDQNLISYGINNFFYISGTDNGRDFDRDYGYVKISQSYDVRSSESDTPFTPVLFRLAYYPLKDLRLKYKTNVDVYGDGFTKHTVETDYRSSRGDLFSADYLFNKNEDDDGDDDTSSIRLGVRVGLFYNFTAGYSLEQSIEDSTTVEEQFLLIYSPPCWSVELAANTTPDDEQVTIMFRLANIGTPIGFDLMGTGSEQ
jgi:LPS-assembly protein